MIRFLIRTALFGGVALYLLPSGILGGKSEETVEKSEVGALEAASAAQRAVKDFANICERDPGVCDTGRAVLRTVGERARDAARGAYETLDQALERDANRPPADLGSAPLQTQPPIPQQRPPQPVQGLRHP